MNESEYLFTPDETQIIGTDGAQKLNQTLLHNTLSYKYYWLMSLVEKVAVEQEYDFPAFDLAINMVAMAWQPVCKHRIGMGFKDGFKAILSELEPILNLQPDSTRTSVILGLQQILSDPDHSRSVRSIINRLLKYVPYRFVKPWLLIDADKAEQIIRQNPVGAIAPSAPYQLEWRGTAHSRELFVVMNPDWVRFIQGSTIELIERAMSDLALYVQHNNRDLLSVEYFLDWRVDAQIRQRQMYFWNHAINNAVNVGQPMQCILTRDVLYPQRYRIERTMPTSFHDAESMWSIFPARLEAKIPQAGHHLSHLGQILPSMAAMQHEALRNFLQSGAVTEMIAADYAGWDYTVQQLAMLPVTDFVPIFCNHLSLSLEQEKNHRMSRPPQSIADDSHVGLHINQLNGTVFGNMTQNNK